MLRFETIAALRQHLNTIDKTLRIGFVPTMGALHRGHVALVEQARRSTDVVVASVFVNPTQFNNPDDLKHYPRTLEADATLLKAAGCDVLFAPSAEEMYPTPPALRLDFGELETVMEGASRPGHFNGVGLVVAKLFHAVQPNVAFFGQKDLQQVAVIRRLINDLSFPIELAVCPTVRQTDGLAMSSRNARLTADERNVAPALYRALQAAQTELEAGQPADVAQQAARNVVARHPAFRLDYVEVAHADTLQPVAGRLAPGLTAVCIAAHLGAVRLIDNVVF